MSVENAETAETGDNDVTTDDRFETELVAILRGLDETAKPWKLRPPEISSDPAKLRVGARKWLVCGHLEGAGYEIRDLELPVERDGWIAAWEVS
jgi:hypothetical protein